MERCRLLMLVTLAAVPFLLSCESATSPESEDPPPEDYVLIDTWTVGAAGGSLTGDAFVIDIPVGAFAVDTEIKLFSSAADLPFGEDPGTITYKLEGASERTVPVRVALRHDGAKSDHPFIAHGTEQTDPLAGDSFVGYELYAAADSSGFLVTHLPANTGKPRRDKDGLTDLNDTEFLLGLLFFGQPIERERFRILYPNSLEDPEGIEAFLMEVYRIITEDLGFDFGNHRRFRSQLAHQCARQAVSRERRGCTGAADAAAQHHRCTLEINENALTAGSTDVSWYTGRAVLVAALFAEINWNFTFMGRPERNWFYQAVVYWSTELFTVEDDYVHPQEFDGHEFKLFGGVPLWSSNEAPTRTTPSAWRRS